MAGVFSRLKQLIRSFIVKDFLKNLRAPSMSESEQKALAIGLINSEQITAYVNCLTTGLPKDRILQLLTESWKIYEKADAYDRIEWLQNEGHRAYYSKLYPLYKLNPDIRNEQFQTLFEEKTKKAIQFADNLLECSAEWGNDGFAAFNDENMKKGILAWDLGRLVVIARLSFDMGYIDEKTAWGFIKKAYETATLEYENWKEFAVSYLIGRGMWSGDNMMLSGLYVIAKGAFTNHGSPWKNLSFK